MTTSAWSFYTDTVEDFAFYENVFSPEECRSIIDIGNSKNLETATTFLADSNHHRDSQISWLHASDNMEWAYRRLTDVVTNLNDRFFKFDIFGMTEGFQFTKYEAPSGKYDKHIDKKHNGIIRKLSLTIQLSDPSEYEGGELNLYFGEKPAVAKKDIGYLTLFPSYVLHEVTPVTKGTRYSLVAWISGKPFR